MFCIYCEKDFSSKSALKKHIINKQCSFNKAWDVYQKLQACIISIEGNNNTSNINSNNINVSLNINIINPITKLNVSYIEKDDIKTIIDVITEYNKDGTKIPIEMLVGNVISDIIHNKDHPENHCVKYIKKRPASFSNTIEKDGKIINVVKNLKETSEMLCDPISLNLNKKFIECKRNLSKDDKALYSQELYIFDKQLKDKNMITKATKNVLKNSILNDPEMKVQKQN